MTATLTVIVPAADLARYSRPWVPVRSSGLTQTMVRDYPTEAAATRAARRLVGVWTIESNERVTAR